MVADWSMEVQIDKRIMCPLRVGDNICTGVGRCVGMAYKHKRIRRIHVDIDIGVLVLVVVPSLYEREKSQQTEDPLAPGDRKSVV